MIAILVLGCRMGTPPRIISEVCYISLFTGISY